MSLTTTLTADAAELIAKYLTAYRAQYPTMPEPIITYSRGWFTFDVNGWKTKHRRKQLEGMLARVAARSAQ